MSAARLKVAIGVALATPIAVLVFPDIASAHALVGRKDLPVPAWLFAWGASLVLIISFALLSVAWTEARLQKEDWRAMPRWFSGALLNAGTQVVCGLIGVGLFVVVLYAGFRGIEDPTQNFSIIFVFYTFWLGMVLVSVLFGDVFRAFNPWRAIGRTISGGFRLVAGQSAPTPFTYPDALGRWPAVLGVLLFIWLELIAGGGASPTPHKVAVATLIYSGITFACMALFGVEEWIRRGEAFNAYFGMFSQLGPFEAREGRLGRRKFLTGAPQWAAIPGAAALVLTSIAVTSFDGAQEGAFSGVIRWTFERSSDIGFSLPDSFRIANTIWLLITAGRRLRPLLAGRGRDAHRARLAAHQGAWSLLRAHPDPDRARLPRRPLLQRLPLPGAGPVHLHPSPTPSDTAPTCSGPRAAGSTTASSARTRSGTSRWRRWSSATSWR